MIIEKAETKNISELYKLQLLCFESEAEMIGSRKVPALMETEDFYAKDFCNRTTLKIVNNEQEIIGAIRYRDKNDIVEVGRIMIHPKYRRQGLAKQLISKVDSEFSQKIKELYTCTKSWTNIKLYTSMGYKSYKECQINTGLSAVYMRKGLEKI